MRQRVPTLPTPTTLSRDVDERVAGQEEAARVVERRQVRVDRGASGGLDLDRVVPGRQGSDRIHDRRLVDDPTATVDDLGELSHRLATVLLSGPLLESIDPSSEICLGHPRLGSDVLDGQQAIPQVEETHLAELSHRLLVGDRWRRR